MSNTIQKNVPESRYQRLKLLWDAESMEPSLSWGLRMAIATTLPMILGVAYGQVEFAEWIALTADCICWISLKGTAGQRFRLLVAAAILCWILTLIGSLSGASVFWSVCFMVLVAFASGMFRNLGERASGLALCIYVVFIITNAYPANGEALEERLLAVSIGGVWNTLLGMATVLFIPQQTPYRRSIAIIWQKTALLIQRIGSGWDGIGTRKSVREIYLAEQAVTDAVTSSLAFHEKSIYQLRGKEHTDEFRLAQVRKIASLVAATMQTVAEELEELSLNSLPEDARLRISGMMTSLQLNAQQMVSLTLNGRKEDETLMEQTLQQLQQRIGVLAAYKAGSDVLLGRKISSLAHLARRCHKLLIRCLELEAKVAETTFFRSYSILKTAYVLHPKHWWRSIRVLFSFDSHTTKFVIRTSLASGLAIAIDKVFDFQRGYWLPFTVMIVLQPYFVATFKKAIDRLIGTISGGLVGGLVLMIPHGLYLKEAMLFLSAVAMIHFYKASYRISAFFITLNLVLLFSVSQELDKYVIFWRAGLTLAGAAIAVVAGFLLFPAWDKKYLPRYTAEAVFKNWLFFQNTFLVQLHTGVWTKFKRQAEVSNSNAFNSYTRAMEEPGGLPDNFKIYYEIIAHNMRITRELNNIHLDTELDENLSYKLANQQRLLDTIQQCIGLFDEILGHLRKVEVRKYFPAQIVHNLPEVLPELNPAQQIYLERLMVELTQIAKELKLQNQLPTA